MNLLVFLLLTTILASHAAPLQWQELAALPAERGVAAPFAGVSHGALLVAGGAHFPDKMPWEGGQKKWLDNVWLLPRPDAKWQVVGKLPHPLAYGVSASYKDSLICVGGSDTEKHYAECWRLTWKQETLVTETLPSLPMALATASGALLGDALMLSCGAAMPGESVATNRTFLLDLAAATMAWKELPPLPAQPRILATAATHHGKFYLFGGAAFIQNAEGKYSRQYLKEAWCYEAQEGWKRLGDLPCPNVAAPTPAPFHQGKLLLLAGDDGSRAGFEPVDKHPGFPARILAYDPVADSWTQPGDLPAPRATAPCVPWLGNFIIPSGEVRPGVRSPAVWSLLVN
jgi:N-acetylneuraminic acid mutarotase